MKIALGVVGLIALLAGIRAWRTFATPRLVEVEYEPPYEYPAIIPPPDWP